MTSSVHFSSASDDWWTPDHIITATINLLGTIDLDPCSPYPDGPVPANQHYTHETDGLSQEWYGRVYMNPPYGREIVKWTQKALTEYHKGRINEAVLLLPARTDTQWFQMLAEYPWCAVRGRLKFSGHQNSAPFPSALFYLGPVERYTAFIETFCGIGVIYEYSTRCF